VIFLSSVFILKKLKEKHRTPICLFCFKKQQLLAKFFENNIKFSQVMLVARWWLVYNRNLKFVYVSKTMKTNIENINKK